MNKNSSRRKFGRVGVLMGGLSNERLISLKSGQAVYAALKSSGIDALSIDLTTEKPKDIASILEANKIDICFITLHGRFGEDGILQGILEEIDMPYTCSGPEASRLSMDKVSSKKIFKDKGLYAPDHILLNKDEKKSFLSSSDGLHFPMVAKPTNTGSSIGLSIIEDKSNLEEALELAFSYDDQVMLEDYIPGREFTVGILDDESLPIIEIIPKLHFFSYEAKYTPGLTKYVVPAQINKDLAFNMSQAAVLSSQSLGCWGCSRVDIILNEKDLMPYILEINSIPGLTSLSLLPKAAKEKGIEFAELCLRLLDSAVRRYNNKKG